MNIPSREYVDLICLLYGDVYDDREEDSRIKGENWEPGKRAGHKSIRLFQEELAEEHGIALSRSKIQKILITGNVWSTERSREIQELYGEMTREDLSTAEAIRRIAAHLDLSAASVSINLPYQKVVYELNDKSRNAQRIEKCRKKKKSR